VRRNRRTFAAAVGVGALVLAGAAAFTNSLGFSNTNTAVAYGSQQVSGPFTVTSIQYGLNTDGSQVTSVTFVANGNTNGSVGQVGFHTGTDGSGFSGLSSCGTGTYDSTGNTSTFTCTGLSQDVSAIYSTDIVIS